jgi:hypothetical protein
MAVVLAQTGLDQALIDFLADAETASLQVRLFTNNVTPTPASILADFTSANFGSYSDQGLPTHGAPTWDGTKWLVTFDALNWLTSGTSNLPQTLYGYVVYASVGNAVWWAEKFTGSPPTLTVAAQSFTLTLALTCQNLP